MLTMKTVIDWIRNQQLLQLRSGGYQEVSTLPGQPRRRRTVTSYQSTQKETSSTKSKRKMHEGD